MVLLQQSFLACSVSLFSIRHFSEVDTYGRPFLELVNLCGMNRLIPEVNSSLKLNNKSSIDRSVSRMHDRGHIFRHEFKGLLKVEVLLTN